MSIPRNPSPMSPVFVQLHVDLEGSLPSLELDHIGSALRRAALAAGLFIQTAWVETAVALGFESGGGYVSGLQSEGRVEIVSERADDADSGALYEVVVAVTNTAKHAAIVEDGHVAFHLPSHINWGKPGGSIKRTKKGRPYLNIPFGHSVYQTGKQREDGGTTIATHKRMMPRSVSRRAARQSRRLRENAGRQHDGAGKFIAADRYHWSGKGKPRMRRGEVAPGVVAGMGSEATHVERRSARFVGRGADGKLFNPAWKSSKFEGLMKTGAPRHTEYMTIRTITPDSVGWNIPAQSGYGIARRVARELPRDEDLRALVVEAVMGTLS